MKPKNLIRDCILCEINRTGVQQEKKTISLATICRLTPASGRNDVRLFVCNRGFIKAADRNLWNRNSKGIEYLVYNLNI